MWDVKYISTKNLLSKFAVKNKQRKIFFIRYILLDIFLLNIKKLFYN